MSNWAEAVAAKAEMKAAMLNAYDAALKDGFDRGEIIAMFCAAVPADKAAIVGLYEYWLNTERPV